MRILAYDKEEKKLYEVDTIYKGKSPSGKDILIKEESDLYGWRSFDDVILIGKGSAIMDISERFKNGAIKIICNKEIKK